MLYNYDNRECKLCRIHLKDAFHPYMCIYCMDKDQYIAENIAEKNAIAYSTMCAIEDIPYQRYRWKITNENVIIPNNIIDSEYYKIIYRKVYLLNYLKIKRTFVQNHSKLIRDYNVYMFIKNMFVKHFGNFYEKNLIREIIKYISF